MKIKYCFLFFVFVSLVLSIGLYLLIKTHTVTVSASDIKISESRVSNKSLEVSFNNEACRVWIYGDEIARPIDWAGRDMVIEKNGLGMTMSCHFADP